MEPGKQLPAAAIAAIERGRKIEAIKIVRQQWGIDLKESKGVVDAYIKSQPGLESRPQIPGRLALFLLLAALAIAIYFFARVRFTALP